jgi:hypothetical protein
MKRRAWILFALECGALLSGGAACSEIGSNEQRFGPIAEVMPGTPALVGTLSPVLDGGQSTNDSDANCTGDALADSCVGDAMASKATGSPDAGTTDGNAPSTTTCTTPNASTLPIDPGGSVSPSCNTYGIGGAWYCGVDAYGTANCPASGPPYSPSSPGPGMCLQGTTSTNTNGNGAWIGLNLNGSSTYDAETHGVVGFSITIAGSSGHSSLRVQFVGADASALAPFVAVPGPGTYDVYFADAQVPAGWTAADAGAGVDTTSIHAVNVQIPDESPAVSYDFCVTSITPLRSGSSASTSCATPATYGSVFCDTSDVVFPVGDYGLQNNIWNSSATGTQCVQALSGGSCAGFSVSGEINSNTSSSPASYPSLIYGWQSGSFYGAYPVAKQVKSVASVPSSWTYTVGGGEFDASYDIWFAPTAAPKNANGGLELMIWAASGGGSVPAGAKQSGQATIDGDTWTVYYTSQLGSSAPWSYVAYQSASSSSGTFNHDLTKFFADAESRGYLNTSSYLLGVQSGFEIWSGGSGFSTSSFTVDVQ